MPQVERNTPQETNVLLEQYKLYYELTDRFAAARRDSNRFHISALFINGVLGLLGLAFARSATTAITAFETYILIMVGFLGVVICISWGIDSSLYERIWPARRLVLENMEAGLSYGSIAKENEYRRQFTAAFEQSSLTRRFLRILGLHEFFKGHSGIFKTELLPYLFAIPYLLLIVVSLFFFLQQ